MARMEAAVRLQEQTASLSSSPFVPFVPSNQFLFKDNTARPVTAPGGRVEMRNRISRIGPSFSSAFCSSGPSDRIHTITGEGAAAALEGRLPRCFQARIRHRQTGIHLD